MAVTARAEFEPAFVKDREPEVGLVTVLYPFCEDQLIVPPFANHPCVLLSKVPLLTSDGPVWAATELIPNHVSASATAHQSRIERKGKVLTTFSGVAHCRKVMTEWRSSNATLRLDARTPMFLLRAEVHHRLTDGNGLRYSRIRKLGDERTGKGSGGAWGVART